MSFSFLGSLANLLPGYIEGQRQAVKDNWYDLNQYNQVQQGQIQNAFDEATFSDKVRLVNQGAAMGDLSYMQKLWGTQLAGARMPGLMTQVGVRNAFAEPEAYMQMFSQWFPAIYGMQMFPQLAQWGMGGAPNFTGAGTTAPSAVTGGK